MEYSKHKDRTPEQTVDEIGRILEMAGICTEVAWNPNEYEGAYSNHITLSGTTLGTNGKGTTREYALASGYAELMERIQNGILATVGRVCYANHDDCGFYDQPDERLSSAVEIVARHQDALETLFISEGFVDDDVKVDALEKLAFARYGRTDGMLPEVPFIDVFTGKTVWLPRELIRSCSGSNGMASGNTWEECLVQGLSEILERHVNYLIVKGGITPPPIPRSFLEQYEVGNIIARIEDTGRYRVHVYDCSLGRGYPVVMSMIVDRIEASLGIKFGAHPSFPIAVERTLTEAFQGRSVGKFTHINKLAIQGDNSIMEISNIRSIMRDGSGVYPTSLFYGVPSWEFVPWGASENSSNEEMLRNMVMLLEHEGFGMLVRDASHLGFPSCHIVVPGMSGLHNCPPAFVNKTFERATEIRSLDHFPHITPEDVRMLYTIEPEQSASDAQARLAWGRWNADRTAKVHSFGQVVFSDCDDPVRLLALTRKALVDAVQPKVSYEVDVAALDGGECDLGDTVAVIDSSRIPEWRLKARVVKRVRTFGDAVICRVTIGTVQPVDYAVTSSLAADVAALQDDVAGIDGNLSVATSTVYVQETVTEAIDDLDELADLDF